MEELNVEKVSDRARATLWGLALGDAMGMPGEMWPAWRIREELGTISCFLPAPNTNPNTAGLPAARVTDDTNQVITLAQALIKHGIHFSSAALGGELLSWAKNNNMLESPLLGNNTRAALLELDGGAAVDDLENQGTTNGAVVRIPPLGIVFPPDHPRAMREAIYRACAATHKTGLVVAGAGAVAAMITALITGWTPKDAFEFAMRQAQILQNSDTESHAPSLSKRLRLVVDLCRGRTDVSSFLYETFGTGRETIQTVPAAFALAFSCDFDPDAAVLAAANLGGDTDTIGAITGAICGAKTGMAGLPEKRMRVLRQANDLNLDQIVSDLLRLRFSQIAKGENGDHVAFSAADVAAESPWWDRLGTNLSKQAKERGLTKSLIPKNRAVILGSAVADVLVSVETLPQKGEDLPASQLATDFGGSAFNILSNLCALGYPATAGVAIGTGPWAQRAQAAFTNANLRYSWQRTEEDNGWSFGMILPDGELTFVSVAGVESHWYRNELDQLNVTSNDLLYLSGFELDCVDAPVITAWVEDTCARLILDPGPRVIDRGQALLGDLLHVTEVLTLNEDQARAVMGFATVQRASHWASDYGCSVVLRKGSEGAWLCTALDEPVFVPAFETVETNQGGVGDAHTSGLIAALAAGWSLKQAVELGNLLAGCIVNKSRTHL